MTRKPEPFLTLGFAAVDWVEHYLIHGPGDVQGQPIELDDEFAAFIVKAYRVTVAGARIVRRAFLSRAKGRSKSGLAAMIACFEALGPCRFDHFAEAGEVSPWGYEYELGEPVGRPLTYVEILNVATEEGQAGNTYDAIYYMLSPETCSPELTRDYGKIDVGITRTILPGRRGFIEPVTSADSSKDGGKSTFIVADETHLWLLPRLKRLHGIMTRNLLKRKIASGWMLETSTMYAAGEDSVAEGTHDYAKSLENGRKRDRTLLFDHRQAADHWDLKQRDQRLKALAEAYGPAADWMNLDAICDSWDDPQVSEAEFRRFWLNQPVALAVVETVIPMSDWTALGDYADRPAGIVGRMVLAVDSDPARSRTSVTVCGARADGLPLVEVIENLPNVDWAADYVIERCRRHDIAAVVIDKRSTAATLIQPLRLADVPVIGTDSARMAQACGMFFDAVTETKRLRHVGQAELTDALKAASTRTVLDAWAWDKKKPTADITPLTSATLALWGWTTRVDADQFVAPVAYR